MKYHKQLFRHQPDKGVIGDCHRTAIACLLDLEPSEVPHFAERHFNDGVAFDAAVRAFVRARGYEMATIAYRVDSFEEFLKIMGVTAPGIFYLLGGRSRNGVNHTVVGCGDAIAHDPALDNSGIVAPLVDDEVYVVQYLVPHQFCAKAAA